MANINVVSQGENDLLAAALRRAFAMSAEGTPSTNALASPSTTSPVVEALASPSQQTPTAVPVDYATHSTPAANGRNSTGQVGAPNSNRPTKVSDVSFEQWVQAARRAHDAGDSEAAKRLVNRAIEARDREQDSARTANRTRHNSQGQLGSQKMNRFEVKAADGTIYDVEAPDERTAVDAMKRMAAGEKSRASQQADNWWQDDPLAESSGASRMIEVEAPDGSIIEFPDGTEDGTIDRVMRENFAPGTAPAQGSFSIPSFPGNQTQQPQQGGIGHTLGDMAKAAGAGLARGAAGLADLPQTMLNLGASAGSGTAEMLGLASPEEAKAAQALVSGLGPARTGQTESAQELLAGATGGASEFRGDTTAGQYAGTIGEFIPSAVMMGGNTPANALRYGAVPGAASEAAGQMTEGTSIEPWARAGAAITAAPLTGLAERGGRRIISPYGGADQGRLGLAQVLDDAGVPVSAGQRVGSEALRRKEGMSAAGQALNERQREALTRAALRTAGANADRATPEVLAETARRIGSVFDDVAKGADVTPDPATVNALAQANQTYLQLAPKSSQAPIIGEIVKRMTGAFRSGQSIPARTINSWRSNLSKLTTSNDGATRTAAIDAMNAIDDAMASTLTNMGRANDVARLATAREQWRNFLAIQRAATGAGEETAAGILSPSALRSAVVQQGRASYAQGQRGELGNLARAAEGVIKPLPTSGTAENIRALGIPALGWAGAGAAAGSGLGGPVGATLGSMVGAAAPAVMGAARMSRPVQGWLSNQMVGAGGPVMSSNALSPIVAALLGTQ